MPTYSLGLVGALPPPAGISESTLATRPKFLPTLPAAPATGPTIGRTERPDKPDRARLPIPPRVSSCANLSSALVLNSPVSKTARASPKPGVMLKAICSIIGNSSKTR